MTTQANNLIETLRRRCREKPGMQLANLGGESYKVMDGFLDSFARFILDETPPVLLLRCSDPIRESLAKISKSILVSERMHWDTQGWSWTDVLLDGTIPEATLLSLIDSSYQLVYDSDAINEDKKHEIDLIGRQLHQSEILNDLISWYGLSHRREDIERVSRPAILLKTHKTDESEILIGQTKIGGQPDLPAHWPWPTHPSGQPLAFLGQVNLSEVAAVETLEDLPQSGVLYFFSVYGWQDEDDSDPQLPNDPTQVGWTQILFLSESDVPLQRRERPSDVNGFKGARVELIPTIALPDAQEPVMASLRWSEAEIEVFDQKLVYSFKAVRDYGLGHPANHLLLGFADYVQEFVDVVADQHLQLLFQIASDDNTWMCWGDGGYIYFWIEPGATSA